MAKNGITSKPKKIWTPPKVTRIRAGSAENNPTRGLPDGNLNSFTS